MEQWWDFQHEVPSQVQRSSTQMNILSVSDAGLTKCTELKIIETDAIAQIGWLHAFRMEASVWFPEKYLVPQVISIVSLMILSTAWKESSKFVGIALLYTTIQIPVMAIKLWYNIKRKSHESNN